MIAYNEDGKNVYESKRLNHLGLVAGMFEELGLGEAIILLELEEVPQATIAKIQRMAHGALRTRLSRIRNSLLKCITNGK